MPQPFPVPEAETEQTRRDMGSRNGFVGAFVRSVRRGPQASPAGKIAIGALVVVLAAGSVIGLSVLLHGSRAKEAPTNAAATVPGGSPASSVPAGKPGKPSKGGTTVPGTGAGTGVSGAVAGPGAPRPPAAQGNVAGAVTDTARNAGTSKGTTDTGTTPTTDRGATAGPTNAAAPKQATVANTGPTRITTKSITNYGSNRCIDVTDGKSGAQLQIYDCSPSDTNANQTWTFYSDETVRAKGLCMTVAGSWASGTPIRAQTCASGSVAQKFVLNSSHDLTNYSSSAGQAKCVDVTNMSTADGAKLQLWTCGGTTNQKWH